MGSTVVAFILDPRNPSRAAALHAGDSRVYRWRAGNLQQLTADHTAVAALAKQLGRDPSTLPAKYQNELVRAVGLNQTVELELTLVEVQSGDVFMLCSDGLSRMLAADAITGVLNQAIRQPLSAVAKELINSANEAGGKDNISVVLIKIGDISNLPRPVVPEDDMELLTFDAGAVAPPPETPAQAGGPARRPSTDSAGILMGRTPRTNHSTPNGHHDKPGLAPLPRGQMESIEAHTPHNTPLAPATPPDGIAPVENPAPAKPPGISQKVIMGIALLAVVSALVAHFGGGSHSPPTETAANPATPADDSNPAVPAIKPTQPLATDLADANKSNTRIPSASVPAANSLLPALIDFKVNSDPLLAELLVDDDTNIQKTPVTLHLSPGRHELSLRFQGLDDRKQSISVSADGPASTNIQFVYGSVDLESDPTGATITSLPDLNKIGQTPYVVNFLRPGAFNWQLSLEGYEPANVTGEISDHQTVARQMITFQRVHGTLQLIAESPDVKVTVDGGSAGMLPANVSVTAGVEHTIFVEHQGRQLTTNVVVKMHETKTLDFRFAEPAITTAASGGKPLSWTNRLGMVFVKANDNDFWVETTRITPQQYERVIGSPVPEDATGRENDKAGASAWPIIPTYAEARAGAEKMKQVGGLPPGFESWHYALPTPQQWQKMAAQAGNLGVNSKFLNYYEWCLDRGGPADIAYRGGFVASTGERFSAVPIKPVPSAIEPVQGMTARFVLIQ